MTDQTTMNTDRRRLASIAAATVAAAALAAPAAEAQSTPSIQYVGDPYTYLVAGQPATHLSVVFQVNTALPSGSQLTVETAGGTTLGTAAAKVIGTSGLCYRAQVTLNTAASNGGTVNVILTAGGTTLQPNPELVRQLTPSQARKAPRLPLGASC